MEDQNIADPKNTGEFDGTLAEEFRRTIELSTHSAPSKASHDSEAGTREPAVANGDASGHGNAKSSAEDPWSGQKLQNGAPTGTEAPGEQWSNFHGTTASSGSPGPVDASQGHFGPRQNGGQDAVHAPATTPIKTAPPPPKEPELEGISPALTEEAKALREQKKLWEHQMQQWQQMGMGPAMMGPTPPFIMPSPYGMPYMQNAFYPGWPQAAGYQNGMVQGKDLDPSYATSNLGGSIVVDRENYMFLMHVCITHIYIYMRLLAYYYTCLISYNVLVFYYVLFIYTHIDTHIYIYIYTDIVICIVVVICMRTCACGFLSFGSRV